MVVTPVVPVALEWGFELQSGWQPPFFLKTNQKIGALSQWEDGIEGVYVFVPPPVTTNWGWDTQAFQPSVFPRLTQRFYGSKGKADFGTYSSWVNFGWEFQASHLLPRYYPEAKTVPNSGDDGIEYPYVNFYPYGWEIQPPQPPHLKIEKAGSVLKGDDGTEGVFIKFLPFSFEIQPPQPPFRINQNRGTILKGDDGTEGIYVNFLPFSFEIQPPQPPHTFFEKKGSILRGIDGIEGILVNFLPSGWEIQPYQPPFSPKTRQKIGPLSQWEDGIEAPYVFVPTTPIIWGWEVQPPQPPFFLKTNQKIGALSQWEDGIEGQFIFVPPTQPIWGYDVQPSLFKVNYRGSAWSQKTDGIEAPYINFLPDGWEIQPPQPPFFLKTNQKSGATSHREDGIESPFIFIPPGFVQWGYEHQIFPWVRPQRNPTYTGDDGIEYPFIDWKNDGWEIQPYQPPHVFVEKRGLILRGDDGIENILLRFFADGWEVQPPQPPFFPAIARKYGALSHPEEGIEGLYKFVLRPVDLNPIGWVIQPYQPPHPRPERSGAWMVGDSGIENIFTFVPPTKKNFEFLIKWRRRGRR